MDILSQQSGDFKIMKTREKDEKLNRIRRQYMRYLEKKADRQAATTSQKEELKQLMQVAKAG